MVCRRSNSLKVSIGGQQSQVVVQGGRRNQKIEFSNPGAPSAQHIVHLSEDTCNWLSYSEDRNTSKKIMQVTFIALRVGGPKNTPVKFGYAYCADEQSLVSEQSKPPVDYGIVSEIFNGPGGVN
jgi:hypothetical protein